MYGRVHGRVRVIKRRTRPCTSRVRALYGNVCGRVRAVCTAVYGPCTRITMKFSTITHFNPLKPISRCKNLISLQPRWQIYAQCPHMSAVDILKATQQHTEPVRCECRWGAYWRNLANTIEPPMCSSDAIFFCQITVTTCYHYGRHME